MKTILVQLPIPKQNFGLQTGNVPLGPASLKAAVPENFRDQIDFIPESVISYLADESVIELILSYMPQIVSFSLFSWNVDRSIFVAEKLKEKGIRILFGGPEATSDNEKVINSCADFVVFGEGEGFFRRFINCSGVGKKERDDCRIFMEAPSPYVIGFLEPEIQNSMLLETQRGCPYSCGYCYYNKARKKLCFKPLDKVFQGIEYAIEKAIPEVYLLDPSLNTRPDLKVMLGKISQLNKDKALFFHSEIRAESINNELADLFMDSGFGSFEIGLQSVNPRALSVMRRPTDIRKFLKGVGLLKERNISPCIDLIAGLPGDDPQGLKRSVDFVCENGLSEDVQFFPLSVIPGTDFRLNSQKLGLKFNPYPPYNIISTPDFSTRNILESFEYAEKNLGISFFPMPDIDLSFRLLNEKKLKLKDKDVKIKIGKKDYISKVIIFSERDFHEIESIASRLTQPYQIFFGREIHDKGYIQKVLEIITEKNPFSPFEVIFIQPDFRPDTSELLNFCKINRPHFLDGDMRFADSQDGNRTIVFTLASCEKYYEFNSLMEREIFIWRDNRLPEVDDMAEMDEYEGILIDSDADTDVIKKWQDYIRQYSEDLLHISFACLELQVRWTSLIAHETYYTDLLGKYKNTESIE